MKLAYCMTKIEDMMNLGEEAVETRITIECLILSIPGRSLRFYLHTRFLNCSLMGLGEFSGMSRFYFMLFIRIIQTMFSLKMTKSRNL